MFELKRGSEKKILGGTELHETEARVDDQEESSKPI
jgi:hypothetical protein